MIFSIADKNKKIAMEYSPNNALLDARTIDFLLKTGSQIVSSANLLKRYTGLWSSEQLNSHLMDARVLEDIVEKTWSFIERSLQKKILLMNTKFNNSCSI